MEFIETKLPGVMIIEPRVFGDERGFFLETFRTEATQKQVLPSRLFRRIIHVQPEVFCAGFTTSWFSPRGNWCVWLGAAYTMWRWMCAEALHTLVIGTVPHWMMPICE